MSVNVNQLYNSVKDCEINLLAGASGLNRVVSWVHMVEKTEIATFLKGGEITFTTGIGITTSEELVDLIKDIVKNGGSAIVLNYGPFIKTIPPEAIAFCEERQTPLFSVPWSVHMAEIMRKSCLLITLSEKKQIEISSAIKNAILFPKQKELYVPHLENYGLKVNDAYIIMIMSIKKQENDEMYRKILLHQIKNYISKKNWKCTVLELDGYILFLFNGDEYTEEKVKQFFQELMVNCTQLRNCQEVLAGIGEPTKNIYCISRSFNQAKSVIDLKSCQGDSANELLYSNMGIYKLLLEIEDKAVKRSFVNQTIGIILNYDQLNDSNLTKVLRIYLKNNGSVKKTAEDLFVHRNTVNYKIRRIGELLNCSLNDYEVCSRLDIALKLYDIIGMEMGHL